MHRRTIIEIKILFLKIGIFRCSDFIPKEQGIFYSYFLNFFIFVFFTLLLFGEDFGQLF